MLGTSPHNEEFILVVVRSEKDLLKIAKQYVLEIYEDVKWVKETVDLREGVVVLEWRYASYYGLSDGSQTFYVSEVDIL